MSSFLLSTCPPSVCAWLCYTLSLFDSISVDVSRAEVHWSAWFSLSASSSSRGGAANELKLLACSQEAADVVACCGHCQPHADWLTLFKTQ